MIVGATECNNMAIKGVARFYAAVSGGGGSGGVDVGGGGGGCVV